MTNTDVQEMESDSINELIIIIQLGPQRSIMKNRIQI